MHDKNESEATGRKGESAGGYSIAAYTFRCGNGHEVVQPDRMWCPTCGSPIWRVRKDAAARRDD